MASAVNAGPSILWLIFRKLAKSQAASNVGKSSLINRFLGPQEFSKDRGTPEDSDFEFY